MAEDRVVNFFVMLNGDFVGLHNGVFHYEKWNANDVPSVEEVYQRADAFLNPNHLHTINYAFINDQKELICLMTYYFKIVRPLSAGIYPRTDVRSIIVAIPEHPQVIEENFAEHVKSDGKDVKGFRHVITCQPHTVQYVLGVWCPGALMDQLMTKYQEGGSDQ